MQDHVQKVQKGSDQFSNTNSIALKLITFDPTPLGHYLTGETIRLEECPNL